MSAETLEKYQFILCPLVCSDALVNLPVDLVINTGSMQEMSEEWVDFYKNFLDRQKCCWFYTLNYFGQPVNALLESENLLSPRLSSEWTARLLRWNPAFIRMQSDRNFLEGLYEKCLPSLSRCVADTLFEYLFRREPSGEILVELLEVVRQHPGPELMLKALAYVMQMPTIPKEALWLCETLLSQAITADERLTVEKLCRELRAKRASGTEAYY